jgi:enoyl-CoA hydratase/carnithine racemase
MELTVVGYGVSHEIATITLNRPVRMNAWIGRMNTEYRFALEQAERDESVGAIIVTGAGRAFCVGADSRALEGHVAKGAYEPDTPADIAKPGYGIRQEFDADFAYHFGSRNRSSQQSTAPLLESDWYWRVLRIFAMRQLAPSSPPRMES